MSSGETDVVIVGAGLAGLSAALKLKEQNRSFIVLEARHRSGGRIHTIKTEEQIAIDLGAQWVSPYHKRVKQLVTKYGLRLTPTYRTGNTIYDFNGVIEKKTGSWPLSLIEALDALKLKMRMNILSKQLSKDCPWKTELAQELDKKTVEQFIIEHGSTNKAKQLFQLLLEEVLCSKLYEVSTLDLLWCIAAAGSIDRLLTAEDYWIEEGAGTLTKRIADSLEGQIQFNQQVQSIEYDADGVFVHTYNQNWRAKKVVLAVPPNLVTRIQFSPPLLADRAQLNERAGMPSVIKLIFTYGKPFWREQGYNGTVYSNQGPVKLTLDSSPTDMSKGVLTTFITGEFARKLGRLSVESRINQIKNQLRRYFGQLVMSPCQVFEKDWSDDEWTRGGYGIHFPIGVISQLGPSLRNPIGPIHWAGTELASEWRMYMEGAIQSGERAAMDVVELLK
ncbi:flavin monoamine oxidase family protein [Halalkalibacter krulwichiae]|uniref:Putrescine oxidase n=1 Tax=Halalkalibacter krulwichiae TaxID=199441 RepID=A0A1X9MGH2_9BACI|nr:NAD(P)/FAD-dependent oxidoreductase [Halalkalibacter krulwichiae]ARK30611.1 Putrescine oxidase [Halalkalibacter krulwichiae]